MTSRPPNDRDNVRRQDDEEKLKVSPQEARQAKRIGNMRWVVRISIALAAIALVVAWLTF